MSNCTNQIKENIAGQGCLNPEIKEEIKQLKVAESALRRALRRVRGLRQKGGYLSHAIMEFDIAWPDWRQDECQKEVCGDVIDLLTLLSVQGHSGSSHSYTMRIFNKLADFKCLSPLTFKDEEFNEPYRCDPESRQNKRMSSVFKSPEGFHYIDDIVWHGKYRLVKPEDETVDMEMKFITNRWNTYTGEGPYIIDRDGNCKGEFCSGYIKDTGTWKPRTTVIEIFESYNSDTRDFVPFVFEDNPQIAEYAKDYSYTIKPVDDWDEMLDQYDGLLRKAVALAVKAKAEGNLEKYCIAE